LQCLAITYLLINGVTGESQAVGMTNNIELDSWNFGASSPADLGGKGLSAGKPSFSAFTCGFSLDSASYQILKDLCEARISLRPLSPVARPAAGPRLITTSW
jgi:type VI protein secretion system component Hcp